MKCIYNFFLESNLTPDDMPLIALTLMLFGSQHMKQTPADLMTDLIIIGNYY